MAAMEAAAPVHSRQLHLPIDIQENKVKNKKKKKKVNVLHLKIAKKSRVMNKYK